MKKPTITHTAVAAAGLAAAGGTTAVAADLVTGKRIKDGSIGLKDISGKARKALKGNRGAIGPGGPAGPAGPAGQTGAPGAAGTPGSDGTDGSQGAAGSTFLMGYADLAAGESAFIRIGADGKDAVEANAQVPAPQAGSASNLQVRLTSSPGAIASRREFMLQINGTDTVVGCAVLTSATTCATPASAEATFAAGDLLSMSEEAFSGKTGPNATRASFSFEVTP